MICYLAYARVNYRCYYYYWFFPAAFLRKVKFLMEIELQSPESDLLNFPTTCKFCAFNSILWEQISHSKFMVAYIRWMWMNWRWMKTLKMLWMISLMPKWKFTRGKKSFIDRHAKYVNWSDRNFHQTAERFHFQLNFHFITQIENILMPRDAIEDLIYCVIKEAWHAICWLQIHLGNWRHEIFYCEIISFDDKNLINLWDFLNGWFCSCSTCSISKWD